MTDEIPKPPEDDIIRITVDDLKPDPSPVFHPTGRIIVNRPRDMEPIEQLMAHPFDDEKFSQFLDQEFPDLKRALDQALRPKVSDHPDELESWEAHQILQRRKRVEQESLRESDWNYLSRLLYEECFSVDQNPNRNPSVTKQGSTGYTTGGLISHQAFGGKVDDITLEQVTKLPFSGKSLGEAVESLPERKQMRELITMVFYCTEYGSTRFKSFVMATVGGLERALLTDHPNPYRPQYDSLGFRLIELLRQQPDFLTDIQDSHLLELINWPEDRSISKLRFYVEIWKKFGEELINDSGSYKSTESKEVQESIKQLLFVRTHPEMQTFFKFLSPSGYFNSRE